MFKSPPQDYYRVITFQKQRQTYLKCSCLFNNEIAMSEASKIRLKRYSENQKQKGLCVSCGKNPLVTKTMCESCRQKRAEYRKRFRAEKLTTEVCSYALCRKPRAPGRKTCPYHLEARKQKRLKHLADGLCPCGRPNPKNKGYCKACTEIKRSRRQEIRQQVIAHYGGVCACCRESTPLLLTIDHKDNDGANHRRSVTGGRGGIRFYRWLLAEKFPKGYQILCWNCNAGRHLNGGVCPHPNHPIKTEGGEDDPSSSPGT